MTERDDVDDLKHLTPETVEAYFSAGVQSAFVLDGRVSARLEIDPQHQEMRLFCPAAGSDPDVTSYERISFDRVSIHGESGDWFELSVDAQGMHYEAYVLLESVVDQLRGGASFRHAVTESLAGLKELLAGRKKMSDAVVTGLIGELLVLGHTIRAIGDEEALASWLGPQSEEHDFAFENYDAEVKTTVSEARVHLIGSDTQLLPSPGRPRYLISVQITKGGAAVESFTLGELIAQVRQVLDSARLRTFDKYLETLGWRDSDRDLYPVRYQPRSTPRAYHVDDLFPAITSPRLQAIVPQHSLISGVSYRVDVTSLPFVAAFGPLDTFCEVPK